MYYRIVRNGFQSELFNHSLQISILFSRKNEIIPIGSIPNSSIMWPVQWQRTGLYFRMGLFYFCHWIFRVRADRKYCSDIMSNTYISLSMRKRERGGERGRDRLLMYFDRTPQFDQINISNRDAASCYNTIWYGLREDFIHLFILRGCGRSSPYTRVFHYPSKCIS